MNDRRTGKRYECLLFVKFVEEGNGEWAAISRNASQSGIMMAVGKKLVVGETITLDFRVKPDDPEVQAKGKIVRIEENAEGPDSYWPHRVGIEFVEPLPDVEPLLAELSGECVEKDASNDEDSKSDDESDEPSSEE